MRGDLLLAFVLAAVLSAGWAVQEWASLSQLLLPDPDDMMRLAQVRDWIAGQGINDWTQYRMGLPGVGAPMHWSRINDFGLAAIILGATPLVGRETAELIAILAYPALLFACALFLSARIGRRLWGPAGGPVAAILTALAYPGTTVFIPGRIDHHALQVVLVQLVVLALMRAPSGGAGIAGGLVAGVSLVVGLETAPQIAALIAVMALLWVARGDAERARMGGFATGLLASTSLFLVLLRPTFWTAALCDAFTPASATSTFATGAALGALAMATPWLMRPRARLLAGLTLGGAALLVTLIAFPSCIKGPYGEVDPLLRAVFLPYIDEANGIFRQTLLARAIAISGVMAMGSAASLWMLVRARARWPETLPIAAVVLVSGLLMLWQVRVAYIGAPLGASVLAGLVIAARRRATWNLPAVIAAWAASAGLVYLELPRFIERQFVANPPSVVPNRVPCSAGDTWRQVDRYPSGTIMAGTSMAAYIVAATRHRTLGAGYHRNNAGNMAMYHFFLSPPPEALDRAHATHTDYVAFCPGDFDEFDVASAYPDSLASQLRAGRIPGWLEPLPLRGTALRFYRVR